MARTSLELLDAAAVDQGHFSLVARSRLEPGGIDPLGLRAINLGLASAALPGVNNTTYRIRVYSLIAWAWGTARNTLLSGGAAAVDARELQSLVDRWEVLFVWTNLIHGSNGGMPGRDKLGNTLPKSGSFRFDGDTWDKLRASRRDGGTNLQAAVNYGPSAKALHWVVAHEHGTFVPSEQVMEAVAAFDAAVSAVAPPAMFRPGPLEMTVDEVSALHAAWDTSTPTEPEKRAFLNLFYLQGQEGVGEHVLRTRTLDVFRQALSHSGRPCSGAGPAWALAAPRWGGGDLRRILASWRGPDLAPFEPSAAVRGQALLWPALQARQLQRIALEAMLCWVESFISANGGAVSTEAMVEAADRLARASEDGADAPTVGAYLEVVRNRGGESGWPDACAWRPETDIFDLMADIGGAAWQMDWDRLPGLCLRAIASAEAMTSGVKRLAEGRQVASLLGGPPDRLPLLEASRQLARLHDQPLPDLWRELILSWVLAQHVRWSVARNGDGKQRLRVTLDDEGWIQLRPTARGAALMADRIETTLSLGADCGLFVESNNIPGERRFEAAELQE